MKKTIVLLMILCVSFAFGQRKEMKRTEAKTTVDKMTGDTTKRVNLSTILLSPQSESSIGLIETSAGTKLMYSYIYTKNWLFVDEILIIIDGKQFTLKSNDSAREVDQYGYTCERNWYNPPGELIEAFRNAKEIKYRLIGKSAYLDLEIKEKKLSVINDFFAL